MDTQTQEKIEQFRLVVEKASARRQAILDAKNAGMKNSQIMETFGIKNRARLFQILAKAGWKSQYRPRKVVAAQQGAENA